MVVSLRRGNGARQRTQRLRRLPRTRRVQGRGAGRAGPIRARRVGSYTPVRTAILRGAVDRVADARILRLRGLPDVRASSAGALDSSRNAYRFGFGKTGALNSTSAVATSPRSAFVPPRNAGMKNGLRRPPAVAAPPSTAATPAGGGKSTDEVDAYRPTPMRRRAGADALRTLEKFRGGAAVHPDVSHAEPTA